MPRAEWMVQSLPRPTAAKSVLVTLLSSAAEKGLFPTLIENDTK